MNAPFAAVFLPFCSLTMLCITNKNKTWGSTKWFV